MTKQLLIQKVAQQYKGWDRLGEFTVGGHPTFLVQRALLIKEPYVYFSYGTVAAVWQFAPMHLKDGLYDVKTLEPTDLGEGLDADDYIPIDKYVQNLGDVPLYGELSTSAILDLKLPARRHLVWTLYGCLDIFSDTNIRFKGKLQTKSTERIVSADPVDPIHIEEVPDTFHLNMYLLLPIIQAIGRGKRINYGRLVQKNRDGEKFEAMTINYEDLYAIIALVSPDVDCDYYE